MNAKNNNYSEYHPLENNKIKIHNLYLPEPVFKAIAFVLSVILMLLSERFQFYIGNFVFFFNVFAWAVSSAFLSPVLVGISFTLCKIISSQFFIRYSSNFYIFIIEYIISISIIVIIGMAAEKYSRKPLALSFWILYSSLIGIGEDIFIFKLFNSDNNLLFNNLSNWIESKLLSFAINIIISVAAIYYLKKLFPMYE